MLHDPGARSRPLRFDRAPRCLLWRTAQHEGDGRGESGEHEERKPKAEKKEETASGQGQNRAARPDDRAKVRGEGGRKRGGGRRVIAAEDSSTEKAIARELEHLANAAKGVGVSPLAAPPALPLLSTREACAPPAPLGSDRSVPTPPSERIENLWEVVRIAAQDRGIVLVSSDSIEDLLRRLSPRVRSHRRCARPRRSTSRPVVWLTLQRGEVDAMRRLGPRGGGGSPSPAHRWEQVKTGGVVLEQPRRRTTRRVIRLSTNDRARHGARRIAWPSYGVAVTNPHAKPPGSCARRMANTAGSRSPMLTPRLRFPPYPDIHLAVRWVNPLRGSSAAG